MSKPSSRSYVAFTPHYQEECFTLWYSAGRPRTARQTLDSIKEDEHGRKPSEALIRTWRNDLGWDARADVLDAKADSIVEDELIGARVMMLKEQASRGRQLQVMGLEYLKENDFDTSASAVSAVFKGANLERTSRGLSEHLVKMLKMPDDKLTLEVQRLIQEATDSGEVIDVEELKEDSEDDED